MRRAYARGEADGRRSCKESGRWSARGWEAENRRDGKKEEMTEEREEKDSGGDSFMPFGNVI